MIYQDTNTPHCPSALFYTLVSSDSIWLQVFQSWATDIFRGIQQFLSRIPPGNRAKAVSHYYWLFQKACPNMLSNILGLSFSSAQGFKASSLLSGQVLHLHYQLVLFLTFSSIHCTLFWGFPLCLSSSHQQLLLEISYLLFDSFGLTWNLAFYHKGHFPTSCKWASLLTKAHTTSKTLTPRAPLGPEAVEVFSELCTNISRLCNNHFLLRFLPSRYTIL